MPTQMIFLNGGSSSGKTGIVRCLQAVLPEPWLAFGVDTFVAALPGGVITFAGDGEVAVGAEFRRLEETWILGITAMVRAGARVIIDEVFLGGADSQRRWLRHLDGIDVLWVGVRCAKEVVEAREVARGDRVSGMAAAQADAVHLGVRYDLEVDTARTESMDVARAIANLV